jgi:hypothetical protein
LERLVQWTRKQIVPKRNLPADLLDAVRQGVLASPLDPQLQLLIERWPTLSKTVQQQIMLLVD